MFPPNFLNKAMFQKTKKEDLENGTKFDTSQSRQRFFRC